MTAFNFPYAVFAWGALPAMCAGNGVVWKPHRDAVLTGMSMARVVDAALAKHGFSGLVACCSIDERDTTQVGLGFRV